MKKKIKQSRELHKFRIKAGLLLLALGLVSSFAFVASYVVVRTMDVSAYFLPSQSQLAAVIQPLQLDYQPLEPIIITQPTDTQTAAPTTNFAAPDAGSTNTDSTNTTYDATTETGQTDTGSSTTTTEPVDLGPIDYHRTINQDTTTSDTVEPGTEEPAPAVSAPPTEPKPDQPAEVRPAYNLPSVSSPPDIEVPGKAEEADENEEAFLPAMASEPEAMASPVGIGGSMTSSQSTISQMFMAGFGQGSYLNKIFDNDLARRWNHQLIPIVVLLSLLNILSGIILFNFGTYLHFLLTQPAFLLARRKAKKWGVVFNAITRQPIDLAIIRVKDSKTGQVIKTQITDKNGRYVFMAEPGKYDLQVIKPNFIFPSKNINSKFKDEKFVEVFNRINFVFNESKPVAFNLPLEPKFEARPDTKVIVWEVFRKFQIFLAVLGPLLSVIALAITPSGWLFTLVCIQFVLFLLFKRLAVNPIAKNWGRIVDQKNKKLLSRAIVRVYDTQYNKLLDSQVSDSHGHYGFLADNNIYYVTVSKPGYQNFKSKPIDLTKKKKNASIGFDISLKQA